MDKEKAEENTEFLIVGIKNDISNFLQKNPIEKLEIIRERLILSKEPLYSLVSDLITDLKKYDERNNSPDKWQEIDGRIWTEISHFQQVYFENFLCFNAIQAYFNSPFSPIDKKYRTELRKKYNLTSRKFQQALFDTLKGLFLEEVKHGGSKGFWNDNSKLQFLALYNRFLIVIKNARKDIKKFIKKGNPESFAEKEILAKYEIPKTLIKSAFSLYDAPQEVALDWAKQEMKLEFKEEYLKDILTQARKLWRSSSKGLISQQTLERNPKIQLILIDINFELGCRRYAVSSLDKNGLQRLKFGTVAKKLNGKYECRTDEEPDDFLVWFSG